MVLKMKQPLSLRLLLLLPLALVMMCCLSRHSSSDSSTTAEGEQAATLCYDSIKERGELRVLTLSSSTSYFLYKGMPMGVDYEMARDFALSQGLRLQIVVAPTIPRMVEMLEQGEGDMIAYHLPITQELRQEVRYCGVEVLSSQVLVQPKLSGIFPLREVTELVGKDIYVEQGSKYEQRLRHLNSELGGGIQIHTIHTDSITTEELIEQVSEGKIPYTIAESTVARLNAAYLSNLDVSLEVSFAQRSSWAVNKFNTSLADTLDQWVQRNSKIAQYATIQRRYFAYNKYPNKALVLSVAEGQISPYDSIFKVYAPTVGMDWRLMAAQCFQESTFNPFATSWAGATGLMQLMPGTAQQYGDPTDLLIDPVTNVRVASNVIRALQRTFARIEDKEERTKFVLASYNAGVGHVMDAMNLSEKYGRERYVWDDNVAEYILLKSNPEYYNDSVCRFGYLRGRETFDYVRDILLHYEEYKTKIKK